MSGPATDESLTATFFEMGRLLGQLQAVVARLNVPAHTCAQQHLRYPVPIERTCPGCRHDLEKHVRRQHLEVPYLLFGWDAIVESYILAVNVKIRGAQQRRAARNRAVADAQPLQP